MQHQEKRSLSVVNAILAASIIVLSVIAIGILCLLLWPS